MSLIWSRNVVPIRGWKRSRKARLSFSLIFGGTILLTTHVRTIYTVLLDSNVASIVSFLIIIWKRFSKLFQFEFYLQILLLVTVSKIFTCKERQFRARGYLKIVFLHQCFRLHSILCTLKSVRKWWYRESWNSMSTEVSFDPFQRNYRPPIEISFFETKNEL